MVRKVLDFLIQLQIFIVLLGGRGGTTLSSCGSFKGDEGNRSLLRIHNENGLLLYHSL